MTFPPFLELNIRILQPHYSAKSAPYQLILQYKQIDSNFLFATTSIAKNTIFI